MNRLELIQLYEEFKAKHLGDQLIGRNPWEGAHIVMDEAALVLLGEKEEADHLIIGVRPGRYQELTREIGETDTRYGSWITAKGDLVLVFMLEGGLTKVVCSDEGIPCTKVDIEPSIKALLLPHLGRKKRAAGLLSDHFMTRMSPEWRKLDALKPGTVIMLKCWPGVRLQILMSKRAVEDPTHFMMQVRFLQSGLDTPLSIDTKLKGVVTGNSVSLDAVINISDPSIDEMQWCKENNVTLEPTIQV